MLDMDSPENLDPPGPRFSLGPQAYSPHTPNLTSTPRLLQYPDFTSYSDAPFSAPRGKWAPSASPPPTLAFRPLLSFRGFPGGSEGTEYASNVGDQGLISGSGRFPWRREWQPTPVFLPGESQGKRALAGYSPWGCQQSTMTERPTHTWSFSAWRPRPRGPGPGLLVQSLCSPGIPSSPGGQSQISCEWM